MLERRQAVSVKFIISTKKKKNKSLIISCFQLLSVTNVVKRLHPKIPYTIVVTNRDKLPEFDDVLVCKYLNLKSLACPLIEIVDVDMDHLGDVIEWSNQLTDMSEWTFLNHRLSGLQYTEKLKKK